MPQPFSTEKKPDLKKREKTAMEALRNLPRAAAAMVALNFLQGCFVPMSELNLAPTAASLDKTPEDIQKRRAACDSGMSEARMYRSSSDPMVSRWGDLAEQKYAACMVQIQGKIWDEGLFNEAESALATARRAQNTPNKAK